MIFFIISILLLSIIYFIAREKKILIQLKRCTLILAISLLVILIILFPNHVFEAAQEGVSTWFNIVFPALLPFFIGAELLIQLGVIRFIGILLEPVIRPLFNVPGEGSFVFAMSITSGYPMGVKLTSELREQNIFTKTEAQRLLSFCSTSGPLFMIGAVAVGMFNNPQLGILIAISHYIGAIATGICFRFYNPNEKPKKTNKRHFKEAFREIWHSSYKKQEPFGIIMGSAVKKSVETLLVIGGFIILFSVIIRLLNILGIITNLSKLFILFGIGSISSIQTLQAFISGFFEMTIGCKMLSEVQNISFVQQAILSSFIISWSGFSIHAQAASFISKTDLSIPIYLLSKIIHAILSSLLIFVINPFVQIVSEEFYTTTFVTQGLTPYLSSWNERFLFSSQMLIVIFLTLVFCAISIHILYYIPASKK